MVEDFLVLGRLAWRACLTVLLFSGWAYASDPASDTTDQQREDPEDGGWTESSPAESREDVALPQQEETPDEPAPRQITVHIESSRQVELQVFEESVGWRAVCNSPCDKAVPTGETYRIDASGVRTSDAFKLDDVPGEYVMLRVDAASSTVRGLGVGAAIVGATPVVAAGTVAVAGALTLGVVVVLGCPFVVIFGGDFGGCASAVFGGGARAYWETVSQPAVAGVLGGGLVLGVTGIVLMGSHSKTHVNKQAQDQALTPFERPGELSLPRVATTPIFSGSF